MTASAKLVFAMILDRQTMLGACRMGAIRIAHECGIGDAAALRSLQELRELGLIRMEPAATKGGTPVYRTTPEMGVVYEKLDHPRNGGTTTPETGAVPPPKRGRLHIQHNQTQTLSDSAAAAAKARNWNKPELPKQALEWLKGRCNYDAQMGHAFQNGATDAQKAAFVLRLGGVDAPGIERAMKLAPGEIVLPCSVLAAFDTVRIGTARMKNPGGHTVRRLRELVEECRA